MEPKCSMSKSAVFAVPTILIPTMVLLSASKREMMVDENAHSVLHAGEWDYCGKMKEDSVRMQQILAQF